MSTSLKLAVAAAVVVLAVGAAWSLGRLPEDGVGAPSPTASLAPSAPVPSASAPAESLTPLPTAAVIDTRDWVKYESERYGFSISHPPGWSEVPATRAWSVEADANDWLSPGMDAFTSGRIRVSAWEVPLEPSFPTDPTWTDVATWLEGYCLKINEEPCRPALLDTAVQLCVEWRDCHPSGLLVSGESEVQAFFTGGIYPGVMVIVTVWWAEGETATAPFGGSRRLLEGFLATMNVWEEAMDRSGPPPIPYP